MPPSSSGLGYLVLSQKTGVRFPLGVLTGRVLRPGRFNMREARKGWNKVGRLAQLGRAHRSHRWGHWFESSSGHLQQHHNGSVDPPNSHPVPKYDPPIMRLSRKLFPPPGKVCYAISGFDLTLTSNRHP
jgi:hypothetical protein